MVLKVLSPGDRPCARHGLSPRSIRFSRYAPPVARRAARQGDILPYPGRLGGVFPALHGSYTYGGGDRRPRSPAAAGGPAPPPGPTAGRPREIAGAAGSRRAGKAKKSGAPEGPALHLYGSAVHRSAAPCSPTGFPRSTIGARRLSFRVRNGSGRAPPAMAADRWAALRPPRGGVLVRGDPRALGAAQRGDGPSTRHPNRPEASRGTRP